MARRVGITAATVLLALVAVLATSALAKRSSKNKQPNIILIITDDQSDLLADTTRDVMPQLNEHIFDAGERFTNYFVNTPICCPSRVSLLRGQFQHNTNFTDLIGPHDGGSGGYEQFKSLKVDDSYLPTWLQQLGYNTYYVGKFIVDYSIFNYKDKPKGWTDIDALITPWLFAYWSPTFSRNGAEPTTYRGLYSTDVIAEKAVQQLKEAVQAGKPFYHQIAPIACHASIGEDLSAPPDVGDLTLLDLSLNPPKSAPRHQHMFNDHEVPQPWGSFNERDIADKPAWVRSLPLISQQNLTYLNEAYRQRLRALRSVDELIARVVSTLEELGELDNTYILYTADNGYHLGTHRRRSGKESGYEEDIRVPFGIRGPGIKPGSSDVRQASHVDIAPTILALAGAQAPETLDGSPLPLALDDYSPDGSLKAQLPASYPRLAPSAWPKRNAFPISYFAGVVGDGEEYFRDDPAVRWNIDEWTWRSVRVVNPLAPRADEDLETAWPRHYPRQDAFKYTVLCTNERELYDLKRDPHETDNLVFTKGETRLAKRLDVLLQVLQTCWGDSCRWPFKYIHNTDTHPANAPVPQSLWEALHPQYDPVYEGVPWFKWNKCAPILDWDHEDNHFHATIGSYPRTKDGALAPVNIVKATPHDNTAETDTRHTVAENGQETVTLHIGSERRLHATEGADAATTNADAASARDVSSMRTNKRSVRLSTAQQMRMGMIHDIEQYGMPLPKAYYKLSRRQVYGEPGTMRWWA